MKNAAKYIKHYDAAVAERFRLFGEYSPYRTWDEFYTAQNRTYDKYLKNEAFSEKTVSLYIKLLAYALDDFGFYYTFQQQDCEMLNNVLYQISKLRLLTSGITAGGVDHGTFYNSILNAFACNNFTIFERFFPKHLPFVKSPFYLAPAMNLLKIMYYKEDEQKPVVLAQARKFLTKKNPILDKAVVNYLIALIQHDAMQASDALEQACVGWQRSQQLRSYDKCFASELHGLYHFARYFDKDFFGDITLPKTPNFSAEFEAWQQALDYPEGKMFYQYPKKMDLMNQILTVQVPEVSLIEYKKNKHYTDVDKFLTELTIIISNANK